MGANQRTDFSINGPEGLMGNYEASRRRYPSFLERGHQGGSKYAFRYA